MQSKLAYEIQGLVVTAPVTAFCFDRQTCYVAQTDKYDTVITRCQLDDDRQIATAETSVSFRLKQFSGVQSISVLDEAPELVLMLNGRPVDGKGQLQTPQLWQISVNTSDMAQELEVFKFLNLEGANITGTPLPQPVIGSVSALSSDQSEFAVMVLDKAQHLQATIYDVAKLKHLIWQLTKHQITEIKAGDLRVMATAYQSFKPTATQVAPETIGSIQSIGFSNGRAIYATKSHGDFKAITKGFWQLKNGFHDLTVDDIEENAILTGIQLSGKLVYFIVSENNGAQNHIVAVEKENWD